MDLNSQPRFLSAISLLLGIIILIGNIVTTLIIWLRKANQEKSKFGLKCHAAYNLLGIDIAYSFVGFTLTVTSIVRLAKDGGISEAACDILGFFGTFWFNFAAVGVLVLQADKFYCLVWPFAYHAYSRTRSNVPLIVLICCVAYGTIMAVLPLTNLGNYSSKTAYTNCLLTWDDNGAFYVGLSLNIIVFLLTIVVIAGTFRQKIKLIQKRRGMKVATSHRNETIIFVLFVSSLFVVCWSPNLVAMLISTFLAEGVRPGEKTKAVFFSITLVPLVLNPVGTFVLRIDCRNEYIKYWTHFKEHLIPKKIKKSAEQHDVLNTAFDVDIELKRL